MRLYQRICIGFLALIFLSGSVFGATVGKLTGRIVDQAGAPLPGANVVVLGTQRGATTDSQGEYLILSLHPGNYDVEASMVGYNLQRITGVQIRADFTTTIDFRLPEMLLEAAELVVVAQRPPIEPDKTVSKYVVTSEDIELTPMVRTLQNFVELQGGVSLDGEVSIRGGSTWDSGYYVDGIRISHQDSRQGGGTFRNVNTSAVQELTVLTGGMGAEYGNAMAGVVSIVTRDGGQRYDGRIDYQFRPAGKKHWGPNVFDDQALHKGRLRWDDPEWVNEINPETGHLVHVRQDYTDKIGHQVEGSISGPLTRDLTFFASSQYLRQPSTLPSSNTHTRFNTQNTLKLTHAPSTNLKIRGGGLYYRTKGWNRGSGIVADIKGVGDAGRNLFLPEGYSASGTRIDTESMQYISLTHILSTRTFYEVKFFASRTQVDTSGVPMASTPISRDADGWFNLPRQIKWYNLEDRQRYGFQFDYSTQYTRGHFLKAGIEAMIGRVWTLEVAEPTPAERRISFMGNGWWQKPLTPVNVSLYLQDKMEFEGLIINAGVRYDRMTIREELPMWQQYGATPMYFTFLRSRDIPTESMPAIQSVAPRLGISHPITVQSVFRFAYGKYHQMPILWSLTAQEWGTNRGDFDFNENGVIDPAEEHSAYGSVRGAATVAGARLVHGNMRLKPQETTSFEVGLDWNFAYDFIFGLTTYYRSVKEKPGRAGSGSWAWSDPSGISVSQPTETWTRRDYEDVRGFELMFRKPFSHHFSFQLAFNVQWASRGNTTSGPSNPMPDSNFVANGHYWNSWTISPDGRQVPESLTDKAIREGRAPTYYIELYGGRANQTLRNYEQGRTNAGEDFWIDEKLSDPERGLWLYQTSSASYESTGQLGRDRRNYGSVTFLFASPNEFGPGMKGMYPLGNLRLNLIYRIYTGTPYRYTPPDGQEEWRYRPLHTMADLSAEKIFPGLRARPALFVEIYNVFNQKDNNTVGPNNQEFIRWGLNTPLPDDQDYLQWGDPAARTRYLGSPRELRMGLRLFF